MDEDVGRKALIPTGRRSGLFGRKSADTMPNSPSSLGPISSCRAAVTRSPAAADQVPEEKKPVYYKQPSSPVYRSLLAPRNATSSSRRVASQSLPTASDLQPMRESSFSMVPNPDSDRHAPMRSALSGRPFAKATFQQETRSDATREQECVDFSPSTSSVIAADNGVVRALQYAASGQVDSSNVPGHDGGKDRPRSARVMASTLPEIGQFSPLRF